MNPQVVLKIDALDNTKAAFLSLEKSLGTVRKNNKKLSKSFENITAISKKMAATGSIAFGVISAGIYKTTQEAARAEGSWNKFNTVFGEGADDMRAFIDDIRKEMPTATHEIARMAADLQDLLVPMGLTRENSQELTEGFVDLANKLAAFNDVDPTEVLEAFKSGLSGSSEPLRRFGINALESSLELEAMQSGLIEAGQKLSDLDPITRNQVKAQALLSLSVKQSADAINGFAENNDSLIRRQQNLQANIAELSVTLGETFMPILDDLVKKITPVINRISEWIEANPTLTRNIILAGTALAAVVAVLGTLGLAMIPIIAAFKTLAIVVVALAGPIGIIVALLGVIGSTMAYIALNWEQHWDNIKWATGNAVDWIAEKLEGAKNLLKEFANFFIGLGEGMGNAWISMVNGIINALNKIQVSIPDWVPGIGGNHFGIDLPNVPELSIPRLAEGGIVTRSILANVGEAGPEAIIPLDQLDMAGGGNITINISGTFMDDRDAAKRMGNEIIRALRNNMLL